MRTQDETGQTTHHGAARADWRAHVYFYPSMYRYTSKSALKPLNHVCHFQVVTAPFLGKVSEVSVYRIIGTFFGGFWGFAMVRGCRR